MRQMVLVRVRECGATDRHCGIFLGGVDLDGFGGRGHQLLQVRHFHLAQCPLNDRAAIEKLQEVLG